MKQNLAWKSQSTKFHSYWCKGRCMGQNKYTFYTI